EMAAGDRRADYLDRKLAQEFGLSQEGLDLQESRLDFDRAKQAEIAGMARTQQQQAALDYALRKAKQEHELGPLFQWMKENAEAQRQHDKDIKGIEWGGYGGGGGGGGGTPVPGSRGWKQFERTTLENAQRWNDLAASTEDPVLKAKYERRGEEELKKVYRHTNPELVEEMEFSRSAADADKFNTVADELDPEEIAPVAKAGVPQLVHYLKQIVKVRIGAEPTKENVSKLFTRLASREDIQKALRRQDIPVRRSGGSAFGSRLGVGGSDVYRTRAEAMPHWADATNEVEQRLMEEMLPAIQGRMSGVAPVAPAAPAATTAATPQPPAASPRSPEYEQWKTEMLRQMLTGDFGGPGIARAPQPEPFGPPPERPADMPAEPPEMPPSLTQPQIRELWRARTLEARLKLLKEWGVPKSKQRAILRAWHREFRR
ncbi:MAG: hypothetical protein ACYTFZ_02925, partial [Planctomycetota bacterium]